MEIINLVAHVQEGHFLRDEILPYDLIVWENKPHDGAGSKATHMTLGDISYDFGIGGKMAALSEKYTHILLVVQTLNMFYLMPWISSLSKDANVTIINLGAGVSSYIHSTQPEMADVALLMPYMAVQEVYDKQTLDAALIAPGKNYIRVPHGETHTTLFPTAIDVEKGIGDVRPHGFEGISGTLIAPGGVLVSAIHALQDLQNEGKSYDLFVLQDYDFQIGKALKESIIKTEKVILLLEQRYGTHYPAVLKAKLWDAGLVDTEVYVFYPQTDKINTILPEYLWEQAQWDGLGIATKINSIH